jgi:TolB protein
MCGLLVLAWPSSGTVANEDQITMMVSGAFSTAYRTLVADWEKATGHRVTTISGASMGNSPTAIPNRLARGEAADAVILARASLDALARDGKVIAGSEVDLAHSRIGMAVRAGAAVPDISSVDSFRRALLQARSIVYSESASGVYITTQMFKTLGIAEQMAGKARMAPSPVAETVARGEADIALQQVSELLPVKGTTFVGTIPDAVQSITTFSAGVSATARHGAVARQLIAYLASAQARDTIRRTGLELVADGSKDPPLQDSPHQIAMTRVFPNAGQIGLFVADADGGNERQLFDATDFDYDATWSPDGSAIVYTSDREGSPDLFRSKPDGTARERLTDDPSYDDQAAFSPDGTQLAFVSTRNGGYARIWTLDLRTKRVTAVTATTKETGLGGDFRPSWSPDGRWIAFSSDRGTTLKMARGRWEALQPAAIYIVRPDGTGLKRITEHSDFCGSPKFSADGMRLLAYCMPIEATLETRRPSPLPGNDTRLVSINIATGAISDMFAGPGVKISPSFLPGNDIGFVRKDGALPGIYYTSGKIGPKGNVRVAAWSPDGSRVVFHRRLVAPPTSWLTTFSRHPKYELALSSVLPAFSPTGDRFVMVGRPDGPAPLGSSIQVGSPGTNANTTIYKDATRNVLGPAWSSTGDTILFGVGTYQAFFNGFVSRIMSHDQRTEGGAQIAAIKPDGTGFREITSGANNNGFPSMAPDGKRFVYRTFGPDGEGLRIMNIETRAVTTLTSGYDNFPLWSPLGDRIMFSRVADGDYEIYSIAPDGTGLKRLTTAVGNDAHQGWSPDGRHIVFASSRMGFKDEGAYTDAPQPYGELFVMRSDGSGVEQLTDNQWEEGAPAWRPRASK